MTKWLKCFETNGPALKKPPVVNPNMPAEIPKSIKQIVVCSVGKKASKVKNTADPTNAIELYRRSLLVSDKKWI